MDNNDFNLKNIENAWNEKFENDDYLIIERFEKIERNTLVENANNLIKKYKLCKEFFYESKEKINYFCVVNYRTEDKKGIILLVINNFIDKDKVSGIKNKKSKFSIYNLRKDEKIENLKVQDLFQDITKESYIKYSRNFIQKEGS